MKIACSIGFALLLAFLAVPGAQAVDDGQTHPKLSSAALTYLSGSTLSTDIVPLTSGSGNVKGFFCWSSNVTMWGSNIQIYVNGGSAQTLNLGDVPALQDAGMNYYIGWVPLNVRFGTSIKVVMTRSGIYDSLTCSVSWALD